MNRKRFDRGLGEHSILDVEGHRIEHSACRQIASFDNRQANISDHLMKTDGGWYFHLTIVGDDGDRDAHGEISQGWYVAHWIDEDAAIQLGRMWGVDRDDVLKGGPNLD